MPKNHTTPRAGLRAALIAGGAAVLLTVAACGSDAEPAASGGATTAPMSSSAAMTSGSADMTSGSADMTSGSADESMTSGSADESMTSGSADESMTSAGGSGAPALDPAAIDAAKAVLVDPSKLTVCTTLPFEPFESSVKGEVVGFDIDMMDFVSKKLGVETSVIDTPFEGIKSGEATNAGTCDIAAAGMTINPERQKVMTFSDPYFDANFNLVVPTASTATTLADLKGKTLGGQASTTGLDYLNAHKDEFGYQVTEFTGFDLQSQAILTGQVDGIVNDVPVLAKLVKDNADTVKSVEEIKSGDKYGFGMKKDNAALATAVNGVLGEIRSDGSYDASYTKWIGDAPTG